MKVVLLCRIFQTQCPHRGEAIHVVLYVQKGRAWPWKHVPDPNAQNGWERTLRKFPFYSDVPIRKHSLHLFSHPPAAFCVSTRGQGTGKWVVPGSICWGRKTAVSLSREWRHMCEVPPRVDRGIMKTQRLHSFPSIDYSFYVYLVYLQNAAILCLLRSSPVWL